MSCPEVSSDSASSCDSNFLCASGPPSNGFWNDSVFASPGSSTAGGVSVGSSGDLRDSHDVGQRHFTGFLVTHFVSLSAGAFFPDVLSIDAAMRLAARRSHWQLAVGRVLHGDTAADRSIDVDIQIRFLRSLVRIDRRPIPLVLVDRFECLVEIRAGVYRILRIVLRIRTGIARIIAGIVEIGGAVERRNARLFTP